jgi:hypothetical protein
MSWSKDDQRVADSLHELGAFSLTAEERQEMLQNIRRRLPQQKSRLRNSRLAAAGIVAAACAMLAVGAAHNDWFSPGTTEPARSVTGGETVDFQVGFDALYQIEATPDAPVSADGLQAAVTALKQRLDLAGVQRAAVSIADETHIRVQTVKVADPAGLSQLLTSTPKVEFKEESGTVLATGRDIKPNVRVVENQYTQGFDLELEFRDPQLLQAITEQTVGKTLQIFLNNNLLSAPTVQAPIRNGKTVITGIASADEAKQYASLLNATILPYKLVEQSLTAAD